MSRSSLIRAFSARPARPGVQDADDLPELVHGAGGEGAGFLQLVRDLLKAAGGRREHPRQQPGQAFLIDPAECRQRRAVRARTELEGPAALQQAVLLARPLRERQVRRPGT